jgi:glycosyltransferase involved in cell wall biosynthesis
MNIVFISTMSAVSWGGSEELWSQTARELAKLKHQVSACILDWPERQSKITALKSLGVDLYFRKPQSRLLPARMWRKIRGFTPEEAMAGKAVQWLLAKKPALVCISMGNSREGLQWLGLCRQFKLSYVVVVHGVYEVAWPDDKLAQEMAGLFLGAKNVFFVSKRNQELFQDQIATRLPRSEIVRNPFNVPYAPQLDWPSADDGWRIANVGRLEPPTKGQDLLIKVLSKEKWKCRNIKVGFYGSGDHFGRSVRKLAAELAPRQTEFFGHVSDVKKIWSTNHALVMPSRCEGMPLAIVEAMLCSRPCIVTDVAGNTELVQHRVNGFVASAPLVESVDKALEEAWESRHLWKEMGLNAQKIIKHLFPESPAKVFAERLEREIDYIPKSVM